MAFIPAPLTARFTMVFKQDGQELNNVYHVKKAAGWDSAALLVTCAGFVNWWNVNLRPAVLDDTQLIKVIGRDMASESGIGVEYTTGLPYSGGMTDASLPNSVTLAVKWSTGLSGRSYRGRTYHIGLGRSVVVGDTIDPTHLAALVTKYNALIADRNIDDETFVVCSYFHAKAPRAAAVLTPILAASIDSTVDNQRRRLPGRGK